MQLQPLPHTSDKEIAHVVLDFLFASQVRDDDDDGDGDDVNVDDRMPLPPLWFGLALCWIPTLMSSLKSEPNKRVCKHHPLVTAVKMTYGYCQ